MKRRQAILNEIIQTKYPQTNKQTSKRYKRYKIIPLYANILW